MPQIRTLKQKSQTSVNWYLAPLASCGQPFHAKGSGSRNGKTSHFVRPEATKGSPKNGTSRRMSWIGASTSDRGSRPSRASKPRHSATMPRP